MDGGGRAEKYKVGGSRSGKKKSTKEWGSGAMRELSDDLIKNFSDLIRFRINQKQQTRGKNWQRIFPLGPFFFLAKRIARNGKGNRREQTRVSYASVLPAST